MKKLLGVLSLGLACTMMFGCTKPTPKPTPVDKDKILEVADFEKFSVVGNHSIVVDGADVDNDWAIKDYNVMTAVSLNQLAAIDANLEAVVEAKGVRGLYVKEGVVLGTRDGGWTAHYKDSEGVVQDANASYALKCAGAEENDDGVWIRGTHYTSPEAHGESLTPDLLWITDNMTAEQIDGFDHDSNPVALESGVFTVVLALYKAGSELACGLGLVKTEARDPYTPPETNPVESVEAIGSFNGWADEGTVELTQDGNTFAGQLVLEADADFKVRINHSWSLALGPSALENKIIVDEGMNNLHYDAGTYNITVTFKDVSDVKLGDELEAFTIEPEGEIIYQPLPVTSMDVAGSMNEWGNPGAALVLADGAFSGEVECGANAQLKVRINCDWAFSLGASALADSTYHDGDGNIDIAEAGTYVVTVKLGANAMADFKADKTIEVFTVLPKGGEEQEEPALTLTKESITKLVEEGSATSYATYNGEHEVDGFKFTTDNVMPNAYLELDVIQFKAAAGTITFANDGYKKVVLKTISTYAYDKNFTINGEVGENDAINAAKEETGKKSGDYDAYLYTLVVEIAAEAETISIAKTAGTKGAGYVTVIELYK